MRLHLELLINRTWLGN